MVEIINSIVYDILHYLDLITLHGKRYVCFRELADTIRAARGHSYTTLLKYIRELEAMDLIKVKKQNKFPFRKEITLTLKGWDLIDLLRHVKNLTQR